LLHNSIPSDVTTRFADLCVLISPLPRIDSSPDSNNVESIRRRWFQRSRRTVLDFRFGISGLIDRTKDDKVDHSAYYIACFFLVVHIFIISFGTAS
jgi:hypothetical protein